MYIKIFIQLKHYKQKFKITTVCFAKKQFVWRSFETNRNNKKQASKYTVDFS